MTLPVTIDDIRAAADRIRLLVHRTPVITSRSLDSLAEATVLLKAETFQAGGSFKIRGASNRLQALAGSSVQLPDGVFAPSSGNHGQAVAIAAGRIGLRATILMPEDAPALKIEATRGYGADVVLYDRYVDDRDALGRAIAEERGLVLIPPYDDAAVIAGQGTVAIEMTEQMGHLDAVLVPVGGGGLISGIATAMATLQPACRVVGIEPEAGDDARRSLAEGSIVDIRTPRTIADGQQAPVGTITFPFIQRYVERIELVSDPDLLDAMRFLFERCKLVVEPSGASGLAGLVRHVDELGLRGARVGVVLSGGNIGADRFCELLEGDL